ncbi:Mevalonate kinase [Ulvibacter litoralis]|uniref:Mevalonate kinase n=1 Tax=Ulvibacter litoralis TaxID=227084 RepID=A0A1G7CGL1_9FLAO|nr:hypothetical protein GCM10008083_08560 [Ulvibacter litoralis]SDE37860.1 Mevalonate kinase [Ulvibacter litoralis]
MTPLERSLKKTFYSNGKLLITGEYLVLDGATALAIPSHYGQSLTVIPSESNVLSWKSIDYKGNTWFEGNFSLKKGFLNVIPTLEAESSIHIKTAETLLKILQQAKKMNPSFLENETGWNITTHLDFPRDWGLGTSSTLINNIAQWANVDAYKLLDTSFGGSGYDIAAAQHKQPLLYTKHPEGPSIVTCTLAWDFTASLFFVHLNQKQDSKEGIARYKKASANAKQLEEISLISNNIIACKTLSEFESLLQQHEASISEIIQLPTIKQRLFSDYPNIIKSLGAWGGDFVLATGTASDQDYFRKKGYTTIIPFSEMIA